MIDTASHAGSWARAIRDGRIPVTEYVPADRQHTAGQHGEGERGNNQPHNGAMQHD